MPITVDEKQHPHISEIWACSKNTIIVITDNQRYFKVTAAKTLKGGAIPSYDAFYEEKAAINVDGRVLKVWSEVKLPSAYGETAEDCLKMALDLIDNIVSK